MNVHIVCRCTETQKQELNEKGLPAYTSWQYVLVNEDCSAVNADVFFDLIGEEDISKTILSYEKPVLVHSVINTLNNWPDNYVRINAWRGFLKQNSWEICGNENIKNEIDKLFEQWNWKLEWVADIPGFIAPRILSMIINEAYFAWEEEVSSKQEIDIAMQLGTNYPLGPFAWSELIGVKRIYQLLQALQKQNSRYSISAALEKAANNS